MIWAERQIDKYSENWILRKVYHIVGGVLIISILYYLDITFVFLLFLLYLVAFRLWKKTLYGILALLILLALTRSKFAAICAAILFTFGDSTATFLGIKYGKTRLPWNCKKTVLGTVGFFLSSCVAMWVFTLLVIPLEEMEQWLLIIVPSLAGSMVESLPLSFTKEPRPNDNPNIILMTGMLIYSFQFLLKIPSAF